MPRVVVDHRVPRKSTTPDVDPQPAAVDGEIPFLPVTRASPRNEGSIGGSGRSLDPHGEGAWDASPNSLVAPDRDVLARTTEPEGPADPAENTVGLGDPD